MKPNNSQHSKGKGKEKGDELASSLSGLNLEDHTDDRVPRSDQYSNQYGQSNYSTREYTDNLYYTHQSMSGYDTTPATAYDAAYGGELATTGGVASYESEYATPSYAAPSRYAPSSYASSGYASSDYSSGYAQSSTSTTPSTVPSRLPNNTIIHQIAQQPPPQNRYELPCEFRILTGCNATFQGGEQREWVEHHEAHLKYKFPTKLRCCK